MTAMAETRSRTKPAVIAISSHVARGTVGNRATALALEILGFPVWSVPTVMLPWHPGRGPATRIVPDKRLFAAFMSDLARAPWLGEVGGILTGYLGDSGQASAIADLIGAVRKTNPDVIYVCDPVIGDNGGLYVPVETALAIRDRLLPLADVATPNRFELGWLTSAGQMPVASAARTLAAPAVIVTSALSRRMTGNLLVTADQCLLAEHEALARPPNGLGDLTAALFLAHRLDGHGQQAALERSTNSVFDLLKRSIARGADELTLEADSICLTQPPSNITARRINMAGEAEMMC